MEESPYKTPRWLSLSAFLLLSLIAAGIVTISAGLFDPKPLGRNSVEIALESIELAAGAENVKWLDHELPDGNYTIRLTAARSSGEDDTGFGLALGDPGRQLVTAVSPLGYLAIFYRNASGEDESIIPWRIWPHVRLDQSPNEIWLDVEKGSVTGIRINRELLFQEPIQFSGRRIGLWGESFGGSTVIEYRQIELLLPE